MNGDRNIADCETISILNLRKKDIPTCRRDESKDKFPWKSQEVHDVVAAWGHLLLPLLAFLTLLVIVIWGMESECKLGNSTLRPSKQADELTLIVGSLGETI